MKSRCRATLGGRESSQIAPVVPRWSEPLPDFRQRRRPFVGIPFAFT